MRLPYPLLYLLALPYVCVLMFRHRLFLAVLLRANPGLPMGGLPIVSKYERCRTVGPVFEARRIRAGEADADVMEAFIARHGFPVVVKPDLGHRSQGVEVVFDRTALETIQRMATTPWILQRYCDAPCEYGVLYVRLPGRRGRIISLTQRQSPYVTGDGVTTLDTLLAHQGVDRQQWSLEERQRCPVAGEQVPLYRIASRRFIYRCIPCPEDARLVDYLDTLTADHPCFYGRFDVKATGTEALLEGMFDILEVNGSMSLSLAPYDACMTNREVLALLCAQWQLLFAAAVASPSKARLTVHHLWVLVLFALRPHWFHRWYPVGVAGR